ncbi:hypothetical protein ASPACDRAFT_113576 [Aspergillus aculeatus ATCC 16872]|uniref:Zn(2)-C6 fungal-type domain-containing protein n=1 Tax=Aspergillus aculeatus (strain ATCC 16872 / CBS 172.66 / WB 5094) TaxID=690307 RepID=A0A1L9X3X3_ASPA1|nr:uncharacterized protein ASPACDRAFT_113576 [Aspergillus aculeatus ATCC 16872]OJK02999.1 hypothetical protein ASPACDRAFT_113576 [Aspergillus aculeatus ATCC 16872]
MMNATIPAVKRRACVTCTAAKAKCTPQTVNMCQRCARLGKSCTYLDLPQTKRRHKAAAPSRVEVLERKVEQLMSQLVALTQPNRHTSSDDTSTTTPTTTHDGVSSREADADADLGSTDIAAMLDAAKDASHGLDPPTGSALAGQPSLVERGLLSAAEAERLVTTFQRDFVLTFPFVVLAHGETAACLRAREPFLFLCVVAATIGSAHPLRKAVAAEIMKHVTCRVVEHSERNLELLRGLLVHCAWYSYPAEKNHPRLLLLIQFCVSMVHDLGLHRKPALSADEQRALLGTFWVSVGVCSTLDRPITMKHDSRTEECLAGLASAEHPSDRWIAPFIRLESFLLTMDEVYASVQASGGSMLVQVTRGALRRQFDSLSAGIEKDLSSYPSSTANALRIEIEYAELRLEELSLREDLWTAEPASAVRTTMLMDLIQRSKELIRTASQLPVSEIAQVNIATTAHVCAAVGYVPTAVFTLLRLITTTTLGGPTNNDSAIEPQVQAVVGAADYPNLITELANALDTQFEGMATAAKEADVTGSLCLKMRLLARCYPYQIRAVLGSATVPSNQPTDSRQDPSMMAVDAANEATIPPPPQIWPSVYGDDNLDDIFPVDDIQWDSLLSNFTGFG